jgi:hypothetical protein
MRATGQYSGEIPWRVAAVPKAQLAGVQDMLDRALASGDPAATRAFAEQRGPAGAREVRMPVGRGTRSGLAGSRYVDHLFPDPARPLGVVLRESKNFWETAFTLGTGSHSLRELMDDIALLRHPGFAEAHLEWRVDTVRPLPHQTLLDLQRVIQTELGDTLTIPQFVLDAQGNVVSQTVRLQSASGRFRLDFRQRTSPF